MKTATLIFAVATAAIAVRFVRLMIYPTSPNEFFVLLALWAVFALFMAFQRGGVTE